MDQDQRQRDCVPTTTYRADFIKRKLDKVPICIKPQEFRDPLAHAFESFLDIDKTDLKSPLEDGDKYLEKVKDEREKIYSKYYRNPLDHNVINWEKLLGTKTLYQVDYCDIEGDILKELSRKQKTSKRLPDGWVPPPTTQRCDYRDPVTLTECGLDKPTLILPINNLGPDEKLVEIEKLRKLDSEYNSVIGKLGNFIVENQMHGKVHKFE